MVTRGTPLDVSNYLGIEVPHKKQKIMVSSVVTLHARVVTLHAAQVGRWGNLTISRSDQVSG